MVRIGSLWNIVRSRSGHILRERYRCIGRRAFSKRGETGLCVTYPHEGENVVLRFEENVLVMERTSLSMRFERGEATKALIRAAGREGMLPLRTRYCALERSQDHHKITLKYELGEPAQKFILSIRIVPRAISE